MIFGTASRWREELKTRICDENAISDLEESKNTPSNGNEEQLTLPISAIQKQKTLSCLDKYGVRLVLISSASDVCLAIKLLLEATTCFGIDIETYGIPDFLGDKQGGLEPRKSAIRLIQLYDGDNTVYVFDIKKIGDVHVLGQDIWERPLVAHNALFELTHLLHKGIHPKKLGCTLLADRVLHGNRRELRETLGLSGSATLKDLSKELLALDISKEQQTSDWSQEMLSNEQIEYAALDAVLAVKIFEIQRDLLTKNGLNRPYQLLRDAQYPVARMELCGIGFDVAKHRHVIQEWNSESAILKETILETIGRSLNLNSSKQVNEWLNDVLKVEDLDAWAKTPKGQLSTSAHVFKLNECMNQVFPEIVAYKHVTKRISSFGDTLYKFIDEGKCRLYGAFSLGTTTTGRMASHNPNMQNMPRDDFRSLFCAREGYVLISLDYSQQELRVAALVSNDKALLSVYEKGEDAHITTAAMVLKIKKEQVTKEHRQLAKALNFGLLYGQGAPGLSEYAKRNYGVDMTVEEAEKHREAFFRVYRELRSWQKQTGNRSKITNKVYTPCGRVRDFSKDRKGYSYTAALNLPIQGGAAEITLHALIRLVPLLSEECLLVNVVHDEVVLEVVESKANEYVVMAKEAMELAFLDVFPKSGLYLNGLVEAKIGKNWAEAK